MMMNKLAAVVAAVGVASAANPFSAPHRNVRQEQPEPLPSQEIQDMQYYHRMGGSASQPTYDNEAANSFQILLEHDCENNLHIFPDMAKMTFTLSVDGRFNMIYKEMRQHIQDTVTCQCPALADPANAQVLDDNFGLHAANILDVLQGRTNQSALDELCTGANEISESITSIEGEDGDVIWNNTAGNSFYVPTCSAESFRTDGCTMRYHGMGETVQVGLKQCMKSDGSPDYDKLPYFVVSCEGPICENNFKVCSTDNDCRGNHTAQNMTCDPIGALFDEPDFDMGTEVAKLAASIGLFTPNTADNSGCSSTVDQMAPRVMANMMSTMGFMMGQNPAVTASKTKMCGLTLLRETFEDIEEPNFENTEEWDGVLPNGVHVFDFTSQPHLNRNVDPNAHVTQSCQDSYNAEHVVPILQHSCDGLHGGSGAFMLTPLSPFRGSMQPAQMQRFFHSMFAQTFSEMASDCYQSPTYDFMSSNWWLWNPGLWIKFLTSGDDLFKNSEGDPIDIFDSWFSENADGDNRYTGYNDGGPEHSLTPYQLIKNLLEFDGQIRLPSSCSQSTWENEGYCRMQYGNLTHLLGLPDGSLTLRFTMSKCADPDFTLPYFYIDCVGSHCRSIFEFYRIEPCNVNSDCPHDGRCVTYDDVELTDDGDGLFSELFWGGARDEGSPRSGFTQCGTTRTDIQLAMNIARVLQSRPVITAAEFAAKPRWCQLFIDTVGDDLDENGEGWGEDLFIDHSEENDDTIDVSVRGLQSWSGATGSDGCAAGIRGGAGAWVGGDRGVQHANYVSVYAITFSGTLTDLSPTQVISFKESVKQQVIDQSQGGIERSDIDYVELMEGSIIAEVHFKPGAVSPSETETVSEAVEQGAFSISTGDTTFAASGSSTTSVQGAAGDDDDDDTTMVIGIAVGVSVFVILLAVGGAVYYVHIKSGPSTTRRVSSTKKPDEIPMTPSDNSPQYEDPDDTMASSTVSKNTAVDF